MNKPLNCTEACDLLAHKIQNVEQLEILLSTYELKFMYISPSSEKPMRNWWPPNGYEPYQDSAAEQDPFPNQAEIFWVLE